MEQKLELEGRLEPPTDFAFPFTPYDIQVKFMTALFLAMEDKRLGIFESPTGTGKSLSLLCGALTWLQQREQERVNYLQELLNSVDITELDRKEKESNDWVKAQIETRRIIGMVSKARRELSFHQGLIKKRSDYLKKKSELANRQKFSTSTKKQVTKEDGEEKKNDGGEPDLDDLILNDDFAPTNYSDSEGDDDDLDEEPEFYSYRIIFASRTHSQIGQFANELKRTKFAKEVTAVSLSSRQNLCINSEVTRLKSLSLINERCLDLQKSSKGKQTSENKKQKTCSGCEYFNFSGIEELKSQILSEPMDIEDLVNAGKKCGACPYYASRKAAKDAQLVLVPYNTILHSGTREGVGLKVNKSVILLDEAHNLIESISNMYSNSITFQQLQDCSNALKSYMTRYMSRSSTKNLLKLKQIAFVLKSLLQFVGSTGDAESKILSIHEFKVSIGIDNLDLYELSKFIKASKLIFKLKGYVHQQEKIATKKEEESQKKADEGTNSKKESVNNRLKGKENKKNLTPNPALDNPVVERRTKSFAGQAVLNFSEFFKSLLTFDAEGRIILEKKTLKFLLLNTSDHFQELIKSARSIILAGGTMKPYDEIEDQLFQSARDRIFHFSCDHVIPDENIVCLALSKGPTSTPFDFTYKNRSSPALMEELSRSLLNLSKMVPGGLVCFLPSYDYETTLFTHLQSSGYKEKIEARKKIFREPKDSNCDLILTEYSRQIKNNPGGAVLFAVVGGKLSEGINFSDDLGRCVVVVGLPFPNIMSLEIKEKVKFVSSRLGSEKGNQLLTNMCSKAVNQSIGRAIRHSSDYAAIILLDHR
ncbi:ATP-dependent DNA helicase DDX11 isoform X2 [Folsomia candida]|nr:ATP-dependent DNA helicase DDX11 isoform X2 [Folsomia candida]